MRTLCLMLIFSFLFSLGALLGQRGPAEIKWGTESKEPRNAEMQDLIGNDENGYYALRVGTGTGVFSNAGKIFVERYNMSMKLVKSAEIKLEYKKKDLQFEGVKLIGNDLYLFTSYRNSKRNINYLFAQTVSKKSLRVDKKMKIVAQLPARKQPRGQTFDIEFSRDSSKILIFGQLPYDTKSSERYQILVTDTRLNPIWTEDVELPYSDQNFVVADYRVDEDGNVHVLGMNYPDGIRKMFRRNSIYEYRLLSYSSGGGLAREHKIRLDNKIVTDLTFRILKNGDLVCAGFYSEKGTNSVKGTYFFKINSRTGEFYDENSKEFGFDFITAMYTDRQKRRAVKAKESGDENKAPELYEYNLDKLVLRSDGGAVLIAEQYYIRTITDHFRDINGFWRQYDRIHYYYGDILVVNINPSGEIDWATHVPKEQVTVDDGGYYSSYSVAITSKAIYLAFNDNGKNFDTSKPDDKLYAFNGARSVVALAEIKPDGTLSRYPLFSNKEEGIITRPKVSKQTRSNELVIYGERSRNYKFARLSF